MNKKVSPELALAALLSGSLTLLVSATAVIVVIILWVYRFNCDTGMVVASSGAEYFMITLFRVYIQDKSCEYSLTVEGITRSQSVFILALITLSVSVLSVISAIILMTVSQMQDGGRYISVTTYVYVTVSIAVLVVDLTFGIHFGMDISTLTSRLNENSAGVMSNYELDMIRLSALLLMSLTLKGYMFHLVNIVLLGCLLVFVFSHQSDVQRNEHPIHKLGALNAYDHTRILQQSGSRASSWQRPDMFLDVPRNNSHVNRAYQDDLPVPRSYSRDNLNAESSRLERSESWLRNQQNQPHGLGVRPFSYLEEPKRPQISSKTSTPEPNWRPNWPQGPPVPAPDYSPPVRRLKSALKTAY
ncbi:uncharacterized protein LOC126978810 isoform X1 [Leptidea sinapis]|uniref:uncharacterized protein LOC126978810 isoform X1 n=1 Tax=Leptidea sinapis TaxID=189913 RepID=UPI002126EE3B|nr:uncharacterized protein LOC126978810 isoform X1 [Leptidea sinapis]